METQVLTCEQLQAQDDEMEGYQAELEETLHISPPP